MGKRCAAVILAALWWMGDVLAQSPSAIERARQAVVSDDALQLALPDGPEPPAPLSIPVPPWLLWVFVAAGVLFVLYHLREIVPGWRRRGADEAADLSSEDGALAEQSSADVLLSADEIARQGRFDEAMHVLLLKSLADIRERLDEQFADSLTSREILGRAPLPEPGVSALRAIVLGVERSYFGKHPTGRADYDACRRRFDELTAALAAGGHS